MANAGRNAMTTDEAREALEQFKQVTARLNQAKQAICTAMMVLQNEPSVRIDTFEGACVEFKAALDVYRDKSAELFGKKRRA